jgi:oligogalacturonide transport system permease protein
MSTSIANAASAANEENERTIRREKINAAIRYTVLIIVGFLMLYPLLWMFTAAMKPNHEIFSSMSLIPSEWSLEGFINGWKTGTEF